ncbi:MAG: peptidase M1 [Acidobacteriales bacterium]|nr:peptidase M1 [Terriglobales bacterium]
MQFVRRPWRGALTALLVISGFLLPLAAAERPRLRADDYLIHVNLDPKTHRIAAVARVKFTALDDISAAVFDLHNGLRVKEVTDSKGARLPVERSSSDSTVRVNLNDPLAKDQSLTLSFNYEGVLDSADDSPVEGLKLAQVADDETYLLYPGRWFPVSNFGVNRFTATINVTVPSGTMVIGSGKTAGPVQAVTMAEGAPARRGKKAAAPTTVPLAGRVTYTFSWEKAASFPGTIIAGRFEQLTQRVGGMNVTVYTKPERKQFAPVYAETALKEMEFFSSIYGPAPSSTLHLVELPNDTVPSAWAPEIAAIAARAISEKTNYRLIANTIARQWWGVSVSPVSRNDTWLSDGFARFSEARYVESAAGLAGMTEAVRDMEVGALAYNNVPLASVGKLDPYSPEAQALSTDKGALILHMLRWVMGDAAFDKAMLAFATEYAGKPASADAFIKIAEQNYGNKLGWFFAQWLDSTGAPEFRNKYTVYRTPKGFRVTGQISQDLDLFRMPVELRIDTDGKTEMQRIEVVGTESPYSIETFGKPRRINIDPNERVLKNSPELKLRVAIFRGQQLVQQNDLTEALKEFQKGLDVNKNSSLAHYRIAEVFFIQRNYQAAANAYREAINGDGEPKWTEVWSHVQLGKIFDTTGQRERATNEYRQALQTNDNTQGALDEARKYLATPYQQERRQASTGE